MNTSAVLLSIIRAVSFTQDIMGNITCQQPILAYRPGAMNSRNCLANLFIKIVKIY